MASSNKIPNVVLYTAPYGLQGPQGIQGPVGPTGPVTSVNGQTGAITNLAVTNAAQSFSGLQTFTSGICAAGVTFLEPGKTTTLNASGINASNTFELISDNSLVLQSPSVTLGDTSLFEIVSASNLLRARDYRGGTYNINFNINRITNTTSALFVNHSTGKNVRLGYNILTGLTNYVDLDVSSTGNLLITPSGGTAQINGNIQANNIVYSVNGQTGNVSITGQEISVKDFGAVGNGIADDTTAIYNALQAASGKTLVFPSGTYSMQSSVSSNGRQIVVFLTNDVKIIGNSATIKCDSPTHKAMMWQLVTNGHNLSIDGLIFNANSKVIYPIWIEENNENVSSLTVKNSEFLNAYGISGGVCGYREATGLMCYGAWNSVTVDKCFVKNISREIGAGIIGIAGTCGITIQSGFNGGIYIPPRTVSVTNCYIENVTSLEPNTAAENVDADGLKVFGGNTSGTQYIKTSAVVHGNRFVNCRGRDIKIQNDESIVTNNISHLSILPIRGGGTRINCQITSGIVSNNIFHFDPVGNTMSPFSPNGSSGACGSVISFYDGDATDLRSRAITVHDNHVYNNVPENIGILRTFYEGTANAYNQSYPLFGTIKGNKVVGGPCQFFAELTLKAAGASAYYTIDDNMVNTVKDGFLASNGGGSIDKTFITMRGNRHGGPPVKHLVASYDGPTFSYLGSNISAYDNSNIGLTLATESNIQTNFIPKIGTIADPTASAGGIFVVQSATLADDETYQFPRKGYYGYGRFCMLTAGFDQRTNFMFVHGSNSIAGITAGSFISYANTVNPDVDGNVNLWCDTSQTVSIKNRLGSTRVFTLFSFG